MFFIRTASKTDAKAIRQLLVDSWRDTYSPIHGADVVEPIIESWHTLASVEANIAAKDGEFLVADDGTCLGGVAFAVFSKDRKMIELKQLYIHPSQKRQGIGRDLFAEIETCFSGAEKLQLEVDKKNGGAVAFYAAHGLDMDGETSLCGGSAPIPAFIMSKSLSH